MLSRALLPISSEPMKTNLPTAEEHNVVSSDRRGVDILVWHHRKCTERMNGSYRPKRLELVASGLAFIDLTDSHNHNHRHNFDSVS